MLVIYNFNKISLRPTPWHCAQRKMILNEKAEL